MSERAVLLPKAALSCLKQRTQMKKVILFATSGGSGFGNTVKELQPSAPNADIKEGKLLNGASKATIEQWVKSL